MSALTISRPTNTYYYEGNRLLFIAAPAAWITYTYIPSSNSEPLTWVICGVAGFIAAKCIISGLWAFRNDYHLTLMWETTQAPSQTAYDSGYATTAEIEAVGFYDAKGRLTGIDLDGRPLFLPHILKPTNSKITAAAGGGKTSCYCVPSCILSLFSVKG
jgi:hypothetical protein